MQALLDVVNVLLAAGADVNIRDNVSESNDEGGKGAGCRVAWPLGRTSIPEIM